MKAGNSSFQFDNWTGQGTLYYAEGDNTEEEELKVVDFVGKWSMEEIKKSEVKFREDSGVHCGEHKNTILWTRR